MLPAPDTIFQTLDATWPAARKFEHKGWMLRDGRGGGQRVSAATATTPDADIAAAEEGMRDLDQRPLFMVRPGETSLDQALAERGYDIVDPVTIYAVKNKEIAERASPAQAITAWPPLAIQAEIWAEGGIGPARLAVMERAVCPRTAILGRVGDRPAATIYVGSESDIAMLHALETRPALRRQGAGRRLMTAAAQWALEQSAQWLTLAVVTENKPANALYQSLGMTPVTAYHYRRAPDDVTS